MRNGWIVLGVVGVLAACGPVEVEMGPGGGTPSPTPSPSSTQTPTPTPTPTPDATPDQAQFGGVDTFITNNNCAGCHVAGHPSGLVLNGDAAARATEIACADFVTAYDPPAGPFVSDFCMGTTALANPLGGGNHAANTNPVDADCLAIDTWLKTGTGTPPACQ